MFSFICHRLLVHTTIIHTRLHLDYLLVIPKINVQQKIHDIIENLSNAIRNLSEIKLLRLQHPQIVEIKHIMLPLSWKDFKDIYVVFELIESSLHPVIKANDDLTKDHYQFFITSCCVLSSIFTHVTVISSIHRMKQLFLDDKQH